MELRDQIVSFINHWNQRGELPLCQLITWAGLSRNRFYDWQKRFAKPNKHNAAIPKKHWILDSERQAIIRYATEHLDAGYRRVTYLMLDEDVVAVSPSTTYRVMQKAGLLGRRNFGPSKKGTGFDQPAMPHEHWHMDFTYLRLGSQFYFLVMVLDGYSRAVLSWDINETMTERDAEITLQNARESFPNQRPRIISDNGAQFLAKDFKEFIKICEMTHVTTSPYYPQSNGKLERINQTIKSECIRKLCPSDVEDARRVMEKYIKDYNEVRLHSAIGYVAPMDRLTGQDQVIQTERQAKLKAARINREQAFLRRISETETIRSNAVSKASIPPHLVGRRASTQRLLAADRKMTLQRLRFALKLNCERLRHNNSHNY
ncbi:MAG: IS3 family transposase [Verrucomicrobiales bacterium]|nr:IS3 family transposase [Verrucomicrobiales bacterium]